MADRVKNTKIEFVVEDSNKCLNKNALSKEEMLEFFLQIKYSKSEIKAESFSLK